ncbi:MAG: NAD(P)/FAD-dependent oxidoreductase, partial [Gemmatimonadota bacterium]
MADRRERDGRERRDAAGAAGAAGVERGADQAAAKDLSASSSALPRREFLKRTGLGAGALAAGAGTLPGLLSSCGPAARGGSPDVAVIGAGAFGVWTAYHLRRRGANVVLVDQYGPGNSRATSGGETRGVRSSYGHRAGTGELWTRWAGRAIERWNELDAEWREETGIRHFFDTGDLIMREEWDRVTTGSREMWDRLGVEYEVLDRDEIEYRWPWIELEGITVGLYEPRAGVVRARRVCETVAEMFRREGGRFELARAELGGGTGDRLDEIRLTPGEPLRAEMFIFALGPWLPTFFPELMGEMIRTPIGNVCYYGTPPGDNRFTYPNMPSYNFPGVTGWPSLPPD